jgi:hypothetical protein
MHPQVDIVRGDYPAITVQPPVVTQYATRHDT